MFSLKPKHLIGVPQFDEEHRQLVGITDLLRRQLIGPDGLEAARETFTILEQHTRIHFANEERVMQQCDYPGYHSHRQTHQNLLAQLPGMRRQLDDRRKFGAKSFNTAIAIWVIGHIMAEDVSLGKFLLARAASEAALIA